MNTFPIRALKELRRKFLRPGNVFLKRVDGIDHKKFFIIVGLSEGKACMCSVYINSHIHPSILAKPKLLNLQVPIRKSLNKFLSYDSYADCSYPIELDTETILDAIEKGHCELKEDWSIHHEDFKHVRNCIIESGLLSEEDIEKYFKETPE